MNKEYKLTISILASNRKDTLPKCLDSLKPLLDNVSSELIVTDTGCDEDLLEIIRKYTDKIIKFTWCNDFGKARNVGLKAAQGQWFMYIDDDEWFENVDELIEFFNGSEEENYVFANYIVRNYTNMKGDKWNEGVVGRIFRIDEDIRFEGKIHEYVRGKAGKTKQFFSYVHHYGYVYGSEEESLAHYERNTKLLIKQIEEEPTEARYYAHLYQEFRRRREYEKSWKYTLMALKNVDTSKIENRISMCSTYVNAVFVLMAQKKYEEAIERGKDFFANSPLTNLARAAIDGYMSEAYMRNGDYEKCIELADEYLIFREQYKENRERYYTELAPMLNDTFREVHMGRVVSSGLKSAIELCDVKKAYKYVLLYDWHRSVYMLEPACIENLADMAAGSDMVEQSVRVFGKLFTHLECSNILLKRITEIKNENPEGYVRLCHIMSQIAGQPGYRYLVNVITSYKNNDMTSLLQVYKEAAAQERYLLSMEKEFFEVAIEKNIPLGEMICAMTVERWKAIIELWAEKVRNKDIIIIKKYMDKLMPNESVHMTLFNEQIVKILERRKK